MPGSEQLNENAVRPIATGLKIPGGRAHTLDVGGGAVVVVGEDRDHDPGVAGEPPHTRHPPIPLRKGLQDAQGNTVGAAEGREEGALECGILVRPSRTNTAFILEVRGVPRCCDFPAGGVSKKLAG